MSKENHLFSKVPTTVLERSVFDMSHGHKTTFNAGFLIPILVGEYLPGDTFKLRAQVLARLATPIYPIMDNIYLDIFYFAIPNRLIWEKWQNFMGEHDSSHHPYVLPTDYLVPQVEPPAGGGGWPEGSIADYFGIPTKVDKTVNALHFRAYNLVYNTWFADQNLNTLRSVPMGAGPDAATTYGLERRNKRHDYFTSCLLWPQKGPGVTLPLGDIAAVYGDGYTLALDDGHGGGLLGMHETSATGTTAMLAGLSPTDYQQLIGDPASPNDPTNRYVVGLASKSIVGSGHSGLYADLEGASAATINSLRQAFQLQRLLERDARGGTRYVEILKSHFGIRDVMDYRLQRPEYLGGQTIRFNVNPVQQTSSTDATSPQGNLAAYAVASDKGGGFSKSFVEHGVLLGIASVRSDMTYQQGLHKMWRRQTKYDFYWPALAHIGEQTVWVEELYCTGDPEVDEVVFGYQEYAAEYRFWPSRVSGAFRSNHSAPLDAWHLAFNFDSMPSLDATFMREDPPIERIVAVPSQPQIIADFWFKVHAARPMPVYSVPGMLDHF